MNPLFLITGIAGAYLIGSIPSAVWIGKAFFNTDVRAHGSGNAGATNTLRVLGKPAGISVLIIDFLKGFFASCIVYASHTDSSTTNFRNIQMVFGAFAVIGHVYPIFAGFKGGKGIATLLGVMVAISWQVSLLCALIFVITVSVTRYISLGSMIACVASPFFVWILFGSKEPVFIMFCIGIATMVLYTHRANIGRLKQGIESKFAFNRKPEINNSK